MQRFIASSLTGKDNRRVKLPICTREERASDWSAGERGQTHHDEGVPDANSVQ